MKNKVMITILIAGNCPKCDAILRNEPEDSFNHCATCGYEFEVGMEIIRPKLIMNSISEKIYWDYIGGHQWSLVESADNNHDNHVCSVEIERGKHPSVAYINRELSTTELEALLAIVTDENL